MKVSELQKDFLQALQSLLPEWRFVSTHRHFRLAVGPENWLFHIACVNHIQDFDAVGDVAVEFLSAKKRALVIGARLGNLAGVGQTRHSVNSPATAVRAAHALFDEFTRVGLPFLHRYSSPATVLAVLQSGGREALLISPFQDQHSEQIAALKALGGT